MNLPQRAQKFEWNLNTVVGIVSLVTTILVVGYWINDVRRDTESLKVSVSGIDDVLDTMGDSITAHGIRITALENRVDGHDDWIISHTERGRDVRSEIQSDITQLSVMTRDLDKRIDSADTERARLSDRTARIETRAVEMSETLKAMQEGLNDLAGDVKVLLSRVPERTGASGR